MDLFCIQARLNWCDSSSLSADQLLYHLYLGVNIFGVHEFHYLLFACVCVCVCVHVCEFVLSQLDMG